jgi:hypothetical protein
MKSSALGDSRRTGGSLYPLYQKHEEIEEAIGKIRRLLPSISEYFNAEIAARIGWFIEVFRDSALPLGYTVTVLYERANRMI